MVRSQKEPQDLGFGGSFEPVAPPPPVELVAARPPTRNPGAKPGLIVVGALVAGVAVFGFMKLLSSAGNDIAKHNQQVVGQIDNAKDADAQLAAHTVFIAAKTLSMENASYADVNPASLAQTEPTYRYTTGPSTGSKVVSVASSATQLGLAVSTGKTCWYLSDSVTGGTAYASGTGPCTGALAIRLAKAPGW
jgi:hypothetical protein